MRVLGHLIHLLLHLYHFHLGRIFLVAVFVLNIVAAVEAIREHFWIEGLLSELVDHVFVSAALS